MAWDRLASSFLQRRHRSLTLSLPLLAYPLSYPNVTRSQSALIKLGFFTLLMAAGPIGTYFLSLKHIWGGQSPPYLIPSLRGPLLTMCSPRSSRAEKGTTSAAISAALVANLVVFAYIVTALREDQAEQKQDQPGVSGSESGSGSSSSPTKRATTTTVTAKQERLSRKDL